jgi:Rps23 Pro-64 3,4-dihydroxylase Tpa1-like proline 4-hydroxylase
MDNRELYETAASACKKISESKLGSTYFEDPFKHIIIDSFLPEQFARNCLTDFPSLEEGCWQKSEIPGIEVKYRSDWKSEFDAPGSLSYAVRILQSSLFLCAISDRLGIEKLVSDPYFTGGGLNVTTRGGLLDVHVDGNYHDATGLNRRANAIWYLNDGWETEWGGEFGIYENHGRTLHKSVPPIFNRLVVFDSHDFSYHGLPNPINFPEHSPRRSLILYYYTKAPRPMNQISVQEPHSALWVKKGLLDKNGGRTRPFK